MRKVFVVAVVLSVAFAGCSRAFTEDIAFNAPPGWVYSAVPFGGGETWVKPLARMCASWRNVSIRRFRTNGHPNGKTSLSAAGTMQYSW